jgi:ABC-2 type transport system ATP-binding protein
LTILLTTHYLEEADHLADRVAIVDNGRIVASGTAEQLKSELCGDAVVVELGGDADIAAGRAALDRLPGTRDVAADGRVIRARVEHGASAVPAVLAALEASGQAALSITVARPSLDDVYLRHTGRTFAAAESGATR